MRTHHLILVSLSFLFTAAGCEVALESFPDVPEPEDTEGSDRATGLDSDDGDTQLDTVSDTGSVPDDTGSVPEDTGSVPEDTDSVPDDSSGGDDSDPNDCQGANSTGGARGDASGYGCSSKDVVHNQGSWFYLDNLHGNGSLDNWRTRLWNGLFGDTDASIVHAAQTGYLDNADYRANLEAMVNAGAFSAEMRDTALDRAFTGDLQPRDAVILMLGAVRHGATFGGGSDNLNWEEDILYSGYLGYIQGQGMSAEFGHGTMNNFKETVSAVMTGGDALTIEPAEWGLMDPDVWMCEWYEVLGDPAWW